MQQKRQSFRQKICLTQARKKAVESQHFLYFVNKLTHYLSS